MARMHAIILANLMSEAIAPHMGRPVINAKVLIISKPFVIPRLQQPRQGRVRTEARSHSHRACIYWEQQWPWQRRWQTSTPEEEDA